MSQAEILTSKTATIDPADLADEKLPRGVVDYAIVLQSDPTISRAWKKLKPLKKCFDAYKLIFVLHLVIDWAHNVWRPWFLGPIQ